MKFVSGIGLALLVSGCGGGGSTPPPPDSTPVATFPVNRMVMQLMTSGAKYAVHNAATNSSLTVEYRPTAAGTVTRYQTLQTPPAAAVTSQEIVQFNPGNPQFLMVGWTDKFSNPASISQSTALPIMASVGTSGPLATGTVLILDNGINQGDIGLTHRFSYEWSLVAVSPATAELCLTNWDRGDFYSSFATDCFRMDAAGKVTAFHSTLGFHAKGIDGKTVYQ